MTLPTWKKLETGIKISAEKRYDILRKEINKVGKNSTSEDTKALEDKITALETEITKLSEKLSEIEDSPKDTSAKKGE